jgi:hypothetical protein
MNRNYLQRGLVLLPLLAFLGCDGKPGLSKVAGKVTLDGQPLPNVSVQFISEDGSGAPASGVTGADGSFRLTTFSTGDGARPGTYKVVVQAIDETASAVGLVNSDDPKALMEAMKKAKDAPKKKKKELPASYSDIKRTTLKQVVPAPGEVLLELRSTGG